MTTKMNLKQLTNQNMQTVLSSISLYSRHNANSKLGRFEDQFNTNLIQQALPPFKLTLDLWAQPCRPFWKQRVNLELADTANYSLVTPTDEFRCLWHPPQGYTRRYSFVPFIWTYPSGANAAVPVAGSWRPVGDTHRMRPVTSSTTWQDGFLISFTSICKG